MPPPSGTLQRRPRRPRPSVWNSATQTSSSPCGGGSVPVIGLWKAWSQEAVAAEVAAGRVVFVDVTADWCITCKVNKLAVVERGIVLDALRAPGVVAMQADWTNPDATIAAYLASFGRYGIPFNAVYGPAAPEGIPLPELLSVDAVKQALAKAAGSPAT
jgi:suppressor for copper-sensitivity B